MKKMLSFIPICTISLSFISCAGESDKLGRAYRLGVAQGRAQVIRQQYWEHQNKPVEPPVTLEKRNTPIFVPEHTTQDGVIIEAHHEFVQPVR